MPTKYIISWQFQFNVLLQIYTSLKNTTLLMADRVVYQLSDNMGVIFFYKLLYVELWIETVTNFRYKEI